MKRKFSIWYALRVPFLRLVCDSLIYYSLIDSLFRGVRYFVCLSRASSTCRIPVMRTRYPLFVHPQEHRHSMPQLGSGSAGLLIPYVGYLEETLLIIAANTLFSERVIEYDAMMRESCHIFTVYASAQKSK
ncbi:hypothetical protein V1509DRAFT_251106 [Lipomyces kononenkoae]